MLLFMGDCSGLGHRGLHPRARAVGLQTGFDRRRDDPARLRGRSLHRRPSGAPGALSGRRVPLRAALRRPGSAAGRGPGGGRGRERRPDPASAGDPAPGAAPGRRRRRGGPARLRRPPPRPGPPLGGAGARRAALAASVALGLAWVFGSVALHAPGTARLRADVQESLILRSLNQVLPPSGPVLNALDRVDPAPSVTGPAAPVARPGAALAPDPDVLG